MPPDQLVGAVPLRRSSAFLDKPSGPERRKFVGGSQPECCPPAPWRECLEAYVPAKQPQAGHQARFPCAVIISWGPGRAPRPSGQGPPTPQCVIWRVRSRRVFGELRASGMRVKSGPVRMTFLPLDTPHPQVAFAFGRRFGNAVVRNRARRRVRAAFVAARGSNDRLTGAFQLSGTHQLLTAEFDQVVAACERCFVQLELASAASSAVRA